MNNQSGWVSVRSEEYNIQAELMRGLLEAQGIDAILSREGYEAAMGLDGAPSHQVEILVRPEQAEQAREVFRQLDAGEFEIDEDSPDVTQG
ncbi:MAG: hypothetical protein EPO32_00265 [Anaerolineae bacterium]|nr:MAG: hypothetical protein EPO32_00265 [Anaerolineae bacterium]